MEHYYGNELLSEYFSQVGDLMTENEKQLSDKYTFYQAYEITISDCEPGTYIFGCLCCIGIIAALGFLPGNCCGCSWIDSCGGGCELITITRDYCSSGCSDGCIFCRDFCNDFCCLCKCCSCGDGDGACCDVGGEGGCCTCEACGGSDGGGGCCGGDGGSDSGAGSTDGLPPPDDGSCCFCCDVCTDVCDIASMICCC